MNRVDRRIGLLFAGFVVLLSAAIARASYLDVVKSNTLKSAAQTEQAQLITTPAQRGTITDRNGLVLALSESTDEVIANPRLIADPQKSAHQIAGLLGMSESKVQADLTKPHTGFVPLAFDVPAANATLIHNMRINGLSFQQVQRRVYPRSITAAQVLGWVGYYATSANGRRSSFRPDGIGEGGLEYQYNRQLSGRDGLERIVNDAVGQPISISQLRPTVPGKTLTLTIDSQLENEVEQVLAGVGATYAPKSRDGDRRQPR